MTDKLFEQASISIRGRQERRFRGPLENVSASSVSQKFLFHSGQMHEFVSTYEIQDAKL
jgi:hypothetical protein